MVVMVPSIPIFTTVDGNDEGFLVGSDNRPQHEGASVNIEDGEIGRVIDLQDHVFHRISMSRDTRYGISGYGHMLRGCDNCSYIGSHVFKMCQQCRNL